MATREMIPRLITLLEEHKVGATWATVGALFCESKDELLSLLPSPKFRNPAFGIRSYLHEVGQDERDDPLHFAPTLVNSIRDTDYQELGSHTFAHLYCLEDGIDGLDIQADLKAAQAIAQKSGVELRSLVFPRNQFNEIALKSAHEQGFRIFRGNPSSWAWRTGNTADMGQLVKRGLRLVDSYIPIGRPSVPSLTSGLYNVPATYFLRPSFESPSRDFMLRRICRALDSAAQSGGIFHLWWHPHNFGGQPELGMEFLTEVLVHFSRLRHEYGMESKTMFQMSKSWSW